jgi:transposase
MSQHSVPAGEVSGLLRRFAELRRKAAARTGREFPIIVIQEAGLDGFWIHRVLQSEGIESHVVDAASILTSRRGRRVKTDRIDGETLVRTLMAFSVAGKACPKVRSASRRKELAPIRPSPEARLVSSVLGGLGLSRRRAAFFRYRSRRQQTGRSAGG